MGTNTAARELPRVADFRQRLEAANAALLEAHAIGGPAREHPVDRILDHGRELLVGVTVVVDRHGFVADRVDGELHDSVPRHVAEVDTPAGRSSSRRRRLELQQP